MKSLTITAVLLALAPLASMAEDCEIQPGMLACKTTKISELPAGAYGDISLKGTTVTSKTEATTGNFSAKDSTLNNLDITTGNADIKNSTLDGKINITTGFMTIKDSQLKQNAEFAAAWVNLKNTTTKGVVMSSDSTKPLCLNLYDNTTVDGDITFSNGNGLIYVENGSKVTGNIHGGKTVTSECEG